MSVMLLDKTRRITSLLHNNTTNRLSFNDLCAVLADSLEANVMVLSRKGKILGFAQFPQMDLIMELMDDKVGGHVDPSLNERFQSVLSTKENVDLHTLGFEDIKDSVKGVIIPVTIAGERLGTVFAYRDGALYGIDDLIVCEYCTSVIGLEMVRAIHEENAEIERKKLVVEAAFNTLSFSELEAITYIFDELDGPEGILVASKVADRAGITRSVIVNALRKFESAGVIESRSSGMKGTYIKVLNELLFDELEDLKSENETPQE